MGLQQQMWHLIRFKKKWNAALTHNRYGDSTVLIFFLQFSFRYCIIWFLGIYQQKYDWYNFTSHPTIKENNNQLISQFIQHFSYNTQYHHTVIEQQHTVSKKSVSVLNNIIFQAFTVKNMKSRKGFSKHLTFRIQLISCVQVLLRCTVYR